MAKESPSQFLDRIMVRLPDGMREQIAKVAERNGRSMNAEVVARLQASFERTDDRAEADYWREEFETLRENARTIEHTLDEFRRDREISHRWLIEAFNAHADGKDPPPFPLEMPSGEIPLRKANHKPRD